MYPNCAENSIKFLPTNRPVLVPEGVQMLRVNFVWLIDFLQENRPGYQSRVRPDEESCQ